MYIVTKRLKLLVMYSLLGGTILFAHPASAKHDNPPPLPKNEDTSLNPQQRPEDISQFAPNPNEQTSSKTTKNARGRVLHYNGTEAPPPLLPRYGQKSTKLNGTEGWVNSKHHSGKNDLGINNPVSVTGDPSQSGRKTVFRRAAPIFEPNY